MFRALTGLSSGVSLAACLCHHLAHAVLFVAGGKIETNEMGRACGAYGGG
jgi:hypothetical protein